MSEPTNADRNPAPGATPIPGGPARSAAGSSGGAESESRMVAQRVADIESRLAEVRRMGETLAQREMAAAERDADIARTASAVQAKEDQMAQREAALLERAREAKAEVQRLEQAASGAAERTRVVEQREREVEARDGALASRESQAAAREEALGDIKSGLASKEQALAEAQERARTLEAQMTRREAELTARVRTLEEAVRQAAQRGRDMEAREHELSETASELKEQRALMQEAKSAALAEQDRALADREKELSAMRMSLEAQRERLDEEAKALEAEKAEIKEGKAPALSQGVNARLLEDRESELEKSRDAVEADRSRLTAMMEQVRKDREDLARERQTLDLDRDRGAAMTAMSQAIDEALAGCKVRRDRLRRVREALRERWVRVEKAKEAIRERARECEKVLAQRETLQRAQKEVEEQSRQVEVRAGKSRAASATLRYVVAVAILGAISWAVAGQVAPRTWVLNATLAADPQDTEGSGAQREAWSAHALELAHDPRLIQEAADRLKRRGMAEFANPAALGSHLEGAMDIAPGGPGSLTVSVTDTNLGRAHRRVETYVASFVALANDSRSRLPEQPATLVAESPVKDPAPVNDERLLYAGAMWGAASLLAMFFAWALWARAVKTQAGEASTATTLSAA